MTHARALLLSLLLVGGLSACFAEGEQQAGEPGDNFFLEHIAPASSEGQILNLMPNPNEYQIDLRLPSGLGLQRQFQRTEVEAADASFGVGIQESSGTTATLSLKSRTTLEFTRRETSVQDILSQMMRRAESTGMALTQGFGEGSSEGSLALHRTLNVEETPAQGELQTLVEGLDLSSGLGYGLKLQASAERKQSQESGRLSESSYKGDLTTALSGGDATAHYEFLRRLEEGVGTDHLRMDIVAPFAVDGATALAEHHVIDDRSGSSSKKQRKTNFSLPLNFVREGALASYSEELKLTNGVRKQNNVLTLATPMTLLGHASQLERITTETINGDSVQSQRLLRLTTQFGDSQGVLERSETLIPRDDGVERHRSTLVESPRIELGNTMTLGVGHLQQDVVGVETTRTSHVDLTAKPIEPLDISANYKLTDSGPGAETKDRQVQTALALSDTMSLQGSISEVETQDGPAAIVRHLEVQRTKHSDEDLGVRVGYTTWGAQEEEGEPAVLAQLSVGSDTKVSVNALYTDYNEKKLEPLEEPTTSVELRAGDPAKLGMRAAYTDQEGRPEPERALGLALRTLGGALRLDYVHNPLGPRGREVMLTDLYELGFQRKIFGSIGMELGYKFSGATDETDAQNHFKVQLDGGQTDRGGQIALSYLSGHFVPYPKRAEPPASLLDLTYKKQWLDSGFITVTVRREEPPRLSVNMDDTLEAQLKYQMEF